MKMTANNPSLKSVVLESSVKPSLGMQFLPRLGLTEDSRTTDSGLLRSTRVKHDLLYWAQNFVCLQQVHQY